VAGILPLEVLQLFHLIHASYFQLIMSPLKVFYYFFQRNYLAIQKSAGSYITEVS